MDNTPGSRSGPRGDSSGLPGSQYRANAGTWTTSRSG